MPATFAASATTKLCYGCNKKTSAALKSIMRTLEGEQNNNIFLADLSTIRDEITDHLVTSQTKWSLR